MYMHPKSTLFKGFFKGATNATWFGIYSLLMDKVFTKRAVFGFLLVTLLVMNAGGAISAGMMMEDGAMHNCPYMGVPVLCNMSPLEHLSEWQSMFAATAQQFATAALLLLLALAIVWQFFGHLFVPERTKTLVPRYRYRERVFDPLRLAFARGIIHTKVF